MIMFHVEMNRPGLGWVKISFTECKNKMYCQGYVDCMDSHYPSNPVRIVKTEVDGVTKVVCETKGRGEVHLN